MSDGNDVEAFQDAKPMLLGLAYRMLGSRADAEDAVQDTFLKWQQADRGGIENAASWLTTACTRRCIDLLRSAHKTRVDYVGAWLPEPIHTASTDMTEDNLALASSLTTAFLLLLERLTPRERAAYLLYEIFEVSYADIARTLRVQESTCRKLVNRARANVDRSKVRHVTAPERQEQLLAAFEAAIAGGGMQPLAALLSDDIALSADGGGKVQTIRQILHGKADVLAFIADALSAYWQPYEWTVTDLNGHRGVILQLDGKVAAAVSFAYDADGQATNIYIMRNPDKLASLSGIAIS